MDNTGFIYILENEAMPGLWKIGSSERENINYRINELYGHSGVPLPFNVVFVGKVKDHKIVEDSIKKQFKRFRVNSKREFFNIEPDIIIPWIKEKFSVKEVTESIGKEYDKTVGDSDKKDLVKYEMKKRELENIYGEVNAYIKSLGNNIDVNEKPEGYVGFQKNGKLFIARLKQQRLTLLLNLKPIPTDIEEGFTIDISGKGSPTNFKKCLKVYIKNETDLKKAKLLIKRAYEEN